MASLAQDGHRDVSIGRIFSRAFATIGGAPLATLGVAFVFGALPGSLLNYALAGLRGDVAEQLGTGATIAIGVTTVVVAIALSMITQGALVRATVAHSEGRRASFGESAGAGLRVILPLLVLGFVIGFGALLGFMLLIVPGVMLYVIWSVAAPVLVEERRGITGSLGRSRSLTKGARWRIVGLFVLTLIAYWLLSAVVGVFGVLFYGGGRGFVEAAQGGSLPFVYMALSTLVQTVTAALWGTIQTSLYVELREWKDGPAADRLADIFS